MSINMARQTWLICEAVTLETRKHKRRETLTWNLQEFNKRVH